MDWKEALKDRWVLVTTGVCVTAVAVALIVTGGDLGGFGQFILNLFGQ